MTKNYYKLFFILFLFAVNTVLWILIIPYNDAPDEKEHFEAVNFIYQNNRLPVYGEDMSVVVNERGEHRMPYITQPGVAAYIVTAYLSKILSGHGATYIMFRMFSVLYLLIALTLIYFTLENIFQEGNIAFLVTAIISILPQLVFLGSYINSDAFTILCANLVFYVWSRGIKSHWSYRDCVLLGVACGLCCVSKLNGFIPVIVTPVLFYLTIKFKEQIMTVVKKSIVVLFFALVFSSWWYLRNYSVYGEFFIISFSNINADMVSNIAAPPPNSYLHIVTSPSWLANLFTFFWGRFGYASIALSPILYIICGIFSIASMLGIVKFSIRNTDKIKKVLRNKRYALISCLFITLAIQLLVLPFASRYQFQPQARYLFPSIITIGLILFYGIRNLPKSLGMKYYLTVSFYIFLIILNIISLFVYVIPHYYV